MKRILALLVFGAILTLALSLVNVPQASADLKGVFTAVCAADDDILVEHGGPTPSSITACSVTDNSTNCRDLMICMDNNKWHVIHDMRTGGAWFDPRVGAMKPLYKLIFQRD